MTDTPVTVAGAAPGVDELVATWWVLTEATAAVSARLGAGLDATGMPAPSFDVVLRLSRRPGHRIATVRLAVELGMTSGGFTKLVDRLQQDDLVRRERGPDGHDDVVLTGHGREAVDAALEQHAADLRRHLLAPLGVQGLRALASLSRALRDENR